MNFDKLQAKQGIYIKHPVLMVREHCRKGENDLRTQWEWEAL